jgi:hypothetical protein
VELELTIAPFPIASLIALVTTPTNVRPQFCAVKIPAIDLLGTLAPVNQATRHDSPDDINLHSHCHEKLISVAVEPGLSRAPPRAAAPS